MQPCYQAQAAQQGIWSGGTGAGDVHRASVPCAGKQYIGADGQGTRSLWRQQFDGNMPLVMEHGHIQVVLTIS